MTTQKKKIKHFLDRFCCFLVHAFPPHPLWGCVDGRVRIQSPEEIDSSDRIGPKKRNFLSNRVTGYRAIFGGSAMAAAGTNFLAWVEYIREIVGRLYLDVESRRWRRSSSTAPTTTAFSSNKFEAIIFLLFYLKKISQGNHTATIWANGMLSQSHLRVVHQTAIPFDPPISCFVIV